MANEYRRTMNLPTTGFPMRASLASREPERLKRWEDAGVYELALKRAEERGAEPFVLHDGPPYANGPIHLGHALNKITKDIINRYQIMQGRKVTYVPGWDCHGQPIEHKVEETLGTERFNETSPEEIRRICREFAVENIDLQRQGFKRLGVLGDWEHPYLTLYKSHDAADIEIFRRFFETGAIYRGRKPVHWCTHCHTALSEAEIEYADVTGPSIYVAFELHAKPAGLEGFEGPVDLAIWTTTPWTLPADGAVAVKPDGRYVALAHDGRAAIVIDELAETLAEIAGWDGELVHVNGEPWAATGEELAGLTYAHPIFDDYHDAKVIVADYVGTDEGTGLVHIAPGHGADDFYVGVDNGIPVVNPVDDDGHFLVGEGFGSGGPWSGVEVTEANPRIIEWLRERGTLIASRSITHSYPHCWRCKNPVIFRATSQWFVSMDDTGLRDRALDAIDNEVRWYPEASAKRIRSMVEGRPDWCLSRQRVWGVPVPSFTCASCGEKVMNEATLEAVEELFREKGSDAWFTDDPADYLGEACVCDHCGSHELKPDRDILDVWWDSGVSHTAVLKTRPELSFPADLYLEGSDQHRGWFQAALLTSMGAWDCPPFRAVLTQGFTLDGQGRKMSKSLGNTIDPNEVMRTMGADIIRLWVASVDSYQDMPCDQDILSQVSDAYRRFRNTYRFLLGELEEGFDPAEDALTFDELLPNDQLVLARAAQVHEAVSEAYRDYRFNAVYRQLYSFVTTELSNGYLNATKDRMYCEGTQSFARRSAQSAWAELLSMLVRDLQPILCFTADEVLDHLPEGLRDGEEYAALLGWYESPVPKAAREELLPVYEDLLAIRQAFTKAYEEALGAGVIAQKTTQAARAVIRAPKAMLERIEAVDALDVAETLVCSAVTFEEADELEVVVEAADGERCDRCWMWRELDEHHLCARCQSVVDGLEDA